MGQLKRALKLLLLIAVRDRSHKSFQPRSKDWHATSADRQCIRQLVQWSTSTAAATVESAFLPTVRARRTDTCLFLVFGLCVDIVRCNADGMDLTWSREMFTIDRDEVKIPGFNIPIAQAPLRFPTSSSLKDREQQRAWTSLCAWLCTALTSLRFGCSYSVKQATSALRLRASVGSMRETLQVF